MLRIWWLGGTVVCTTLIVFFLSVGGYRELAGLPLTRSDVLGGSLFVVLSFIVVALATAETVRGATGEISRLSGLATGSAVIAGLVLGCLASSGFIRDQIKVNAGIDRDICQDALAPRPNVTDREPRAIPAAPSEASLTQCLPVARVCRAAQQEWDDSRARAFIGAHPRQPDFELMNSFPREGALAVCVRDKAR